MSNDRGSKAFGYIIEVVVAFVVVGTFFVYSMTGTSFSPTTMPAGLSTPGTGR